MNLGLSFLRKLLALEQVHFAIRKFENLGFFSGSTKALSPVRPFECPPDSPDTNRAPELAGTEKHVCPFNSVKKLEIQKWRPSRWRLLKKKHSGVLH